MRTIRNIIRNYKDKVIFLNFACEQLNLEDK